MKKSVNFLNMNSEESKKRIFRQKSHVNVPRAITVCVSVQ